MSKYDKFFEYAKKYGIEEAELSISSSHSLSFSLFHGEIDNYSDNNAMSVFARGKINGKCASASCDVWSKEKAEYLAKQIANNAKTIENDDPVIIYKGSKKYHKVNTFNKDLSSIPFETKFNLLKELETKLKNYDARIIEVPGVEYSESEEIHTLINSNGLKLVTKNNDYCYVAQALASENGQTKSNYDYFLDNDFSKFNVDKLVKDVAEGTLEKLGGILCESKKYKAVLAPSVVSSFLRAFIGHTDAEEVQKKSSLFIGKLNTKIASSKITIQDRPLDKTIFARWFDDEGVATYNKDIVKNGVLKTYLYTLTTAAKENRESTGNGFGAGSKKSADASSLTLKPGKFTQNQLFEKAIDGVYITEVSGLHAGLNPQSGNFSLQSSGFIIENGKKSTPLDLITVSGNLMELFKDVIAVGNDNKLFASGTSCPSILVKNISISGK